MYQLQLPPLLMNRLRSSTARTTKLLQLPWYHRATTAVEEE